MTYGENKRTWSQSRGGARGGRGGSAMKRPRFSGFIADENQPDENEVVEVGLLVRLYWVGVLIGKKGATIKELSKVSNAKMTFGDDDVVVDQEKYHVMAVSGTRDQITKACCAIAEKLAVETQSKDHKLVFLVPDTFCGMFIGKKGANVKKMKAAGGDNLWIKLSKEPIKLPGVTEATTCTIFGPKEEVHKAIEIASEILGDISSRLKMTMESELPPPSYGDGFASGRGEPPGYGGGFRDIDDFESRGGPPRYGGRGIDSYGGPPGYGGRDIDSRGRLPDYGSRDIDSRRGPPDYGYNGRSRDIRDINGPGVKEYRGGLDRGRESYGRNGPGVREYRGGLHRGRESHGGGGDPVERMRGGMREDYPTGGGFSAGAYGGRSDRAGGYDGVPYRRGGSRGSEGWRGRGKY